MAGVISVVSRAGAYPASAATPSVSLRLTAPSGREPRSPPYPQIKAQRSGFDLDKEEGADGYGAWGKGHKRNAVGFF